MLFILFLIVIVFLLARYAAAPFTRIQNKKSFVQKVVPLEIIAHRGGSFEAPENTILAFENAVKLGVQAIETDIHTTKDGVLVLFHDHILERTTNGKGLLKDKTWAELEKLDAGFYFSQDNGKTFPFRGKGIKIPRVKEALDKFQNIKWILEIKNEDADYQEQLLTLVKERNLLHQVCFSSNFKNVVERVRILEPRVATNAAEKEIKNIITFYYLWLLPFYKPRASAVQVPLRHENLTIVTPRWVAAMQERGFVVQVWTINEESEMRELISMGVDGIITDRPTLLKSLLERGF